MVGATESSEVINRNTAIDLLRGLAILGVVASHSNQISKAINNNQLHNQLSALIDMGRYGVELFFFISGFLLFSLYGIQGEKLGRKYAKKRAARIYPLWIVFLFIAILRVNYSGLAGTFPELRLVSESLQTLYGNFVLITLGATFTLFVSATLWNSVLQGGWSIQAEVMHYLLFPTLRNKSINKILGFLLLLNLITLELVVFREQIAFLPEPINYCIDLWIRLGLCSTFGFFVLGGLSYLMMSGSQISRQIRDSNLSKFLVFLYLVSFLFIPCPFGEQLSAIIFVVACVGLTKLFLPNRIVCNTIVYFGKYSYFIYFAHFYFLSLFVWTYQNIFNFESGKVSQVVVFISVLLSSIFLSLILAIPSMKYFEKRFIDYARNS